jgi:hypothetical protein
MLRPLHGRREDGALSSHEERYKGRRPRLVVEADAGDARYRGLAEREVIHIRRRHLGLAALGAAWAAFGVAAMFLLHPLPHVLTWARSRSWQAVTCRVTLASAGPADAEAPAHQLEYEYQFGGQTWFWGSASSASRATVEADQERLESAQTCYVNPRDPCESLLERTYPASDGLACAALALLCVLPGVVGVVRGVRAT